jgi:hypothetical protein
MAITIFSATPDQITQQNRRKAVKTFSSVISRYMIKAFIGSQCHVKVVNEEIVR